MTKIEIEVPNVPLPDAKPQSNFWLRAAINVESGFPAGGSNGRAAIANILRQIGQSL